MFILINKNKQKTNLLTLSTVLLILLLSILYNILYIKINNIYIF